MVNSGKMKIISKWSPNFFVAVCIYPYNTGHGVAVRIKYDLVSCRWNYAYSDFLYFYISSLSLLFQILHFLQIGFGNTLQ